MDENGRSNLDRMVAGEVSASERRILLTKWLGDAWCVQWDHALAHFDVMHSGEKNGCCLGLGGHGRDKIRLQGLEGEYNFGPEDHGPEATSSADEEMSSDGEVDSELAEDAGVEDEIEITDR